MYPSRWSSSLNKEVIHAPSNGTVHCGGAHLLRSCRCRRRCGTHDPRDPPAEWSTASSMLQGSLMPGGPGGMETDVGPASRAGRGRAARGHRRATDSAQMPKNEALGPPRCLASAMFCPCHAIRLRLLSGQFAQFFDRTSGRKRNQGRAPINAGSCTPDTSSEWELTWTPTSPIAPDISALRSRSPDPYSWSELMRRVFSIDILHCTHCGGTAKLIAFITDPPVIRRILSHLRLPTDSPAVTPARPPPQMALDF